VPVQGRKRWALGIGFTVVDAGRRVGQVFHRCHTRATTPSSCGKAAQRRITSHHLCPPRERHEHGDQPPS
jgi:hypothetical protein